MSSCVVLRRVASCCVVLRRVATGREGLSGVEWSSVVSCVVCFKKYILNSYIIATSLQEPAASAAEEMMKRALQRAVSKPTVEAYRPTVSRRLSSQLAAFAEQSQEPPRLEKEQPKYLWREHPSPFLQTFLSTSF